VVARDGVPTGNLVWKDTALVPVGSTVDLLILMHSTASFAWAHIYRSVRSGDYLEHDFTK
jgi:hypothetical protein